MQSLHNEASRDKQGHTERMATIEQKTVGMNNDHRERMTQMGYNNDQTLRTMDYEHERALIAAKTELELKIRQLDQESKRMDTETERMQNELDVKKEETKKHQMDVELTRELEKNKHQEQLAKINLELEKHQTELLNKVTIEKQVNADKAAARAHELEKCKEEGLVKLRLAQHQFESLQMTVKAEVMKIEKQGIEKENAQMLEIVRMKMAEVEMANQTVLQVTGHLIDACRNNKPTSFYEKMIDRFQDHITRVSTELSAMQADYYSRLSNGPQSKPYSKQ